MLDVVEILVKVMFDDFGRAFGRRVSGDECLSESVETLVMFVFQVACPESFCEALHIRIRGVRL